MRLREQNQLVMRDGDALGECMELPAPEAEVMKGVPWGRHDCLFTPAYWAAQAWLHSQALKIVPIRLGKSLIEEVSACILGGYGAPSEIGYAAFQSVRDAGLLNGPPPTCSALEKILSSPLSVGNRSIHYRFWRQRSRYLTDAIKTLKQSPPPEHSHILFRDYLTEIDGIGLKTASWITRNWLDSDAVAVLDIHVLRAGCIMGIFSPKANVNRDYKLLESVFLHFAFAISVRASRLDALIWRQMKSSGPLGLRALHALHGEASSNILPNAA